MSEGVTTLRFLRVWQEKYGFEEACLLYYFCYCSKAARAGGKDEMSARGYVYRTASQLRRRFPFWSEYVLRGRIKNLLKAGALTAVDEYERGFRRGRNFLPCAEVLSEFAEAELRPAVKSQIREINADDKKTAADAEKIDKHITDNNNINKTNIVPVFCEIENYCKEKGLVVEPIRFFEYYEATGWRSGAAEIRDWRAMLRKWDADERARARGKRVHYLESGDEGDADDLERVLSYLTPEERAEIEGGLYADA